MKNTHTTILILIFRLFDAFMEEAQFYIVMECILGGELFDDIVQRSVYSEIDACKCMLQILQGLKFCHDKNIIHRDMVKSYAYYTVTLFN